MDIAVAVYRVVVKRDVRLVKLARLGGEEVEPGDVVVVQMEVGETRHGVERGRDDVRDVARDHSETLQGGQVLEHGGRQTRHVTPAQRQHLQSLQAAEGAAREGQRVVGQVKRGQSRERLQRGGRHLSQAAAGQVERGEAAEAGHRLGGRRQLQRVAAEVKRLEVHEGGQRLRRDVADGVPGEVEHAQTAQRAERARHRIEAAVAHAQARHADYVVEGAVGDEADSVVTQIDVGHVQTLEVVFAQRTDARVTEQDPGEWQTSENEELRNLPQGAPAAVDGAVGAIWRLIAVARQRIRTGCFVFDGSSGPTEETQHQEAPSYLVVSSCHG